MIHANLAGTPDPLWATDRFVARGNGRLTENVRNVRVVRRIALLPAGAGGYGGNEPS